MTPPQLHRRHPTAPADLALDLWVCSALSAAYDATLQEPIPEHLLRLAQELTRRPGPAKRGAY